jgi:prolyl-tRNA synthetase
MYNKALDFRDSNIHKVDTYEDFKLALDKGGFVYAHWDGSSETETRIKEETKATIRCIPLDNPLEDGKCILTGNPSTQRVMFARAY